MLLFSLIAKVLSIFIIVIIVFFFWEIKLLINSAKVRLCLLKKNEVLKVKLKTSKLASSSFVLLELRYFYFTSIDD